MSSDYYVGLISGTSMDGIDAILVNLAQPAKPQIKNFLTLTYAPDLRRDLGMVAAGGAVTAGFLAGLDARLGEAFANAVLAVLDGTSPSVVRAIGSHGQNVYHGPGDQPPVTLQLANPHVIAQRTGCQVVADFRRRDLALGGEGAPLAPLLHDQLFRSASEDRAVLNLGGIANLTLLPGDPTAAVTGFDTGPGMCLMDEWCHRVRHQPFDSDGNWAATGRVSESLLAALLDESWFERPPPKSTGREYFNLHWLESHSGDLELDAAAMQATLCELTARTVVAALNATGPGSERLLVCGGGAHNGLLLSRLSALLDPVRVESVAKYGVSPDAVEALLFAELARRAVNGQSCDLSGVTGASAHLYGVLYPA